MMFHTVNTPTKPVSKIKKQNLINTQNPLILPDPTSYTTVTTILTSNHIDFVCFCPLHKRNNMVCIALWYFTPGIQSIDVILLWGLMLAIPLRAENLLKWMNGQMKKQIRKYEGQLML